MKEIERCIFDMSDLDISRPYYSITLYKYRFLDSLNDLEIKFFVLLVNPTNYEYIYNRYPKFQYLIFNPISKCVSSLPIIGRAIEGFHFKRFVEKSGCKTFFSCNNIDYRIDGKFNLRKVVVIHDIKAIWEGSGVLGRIYQKYVVRKYYRDLINNSDVAIAISNYTKDNIVKSICDIDASKIKVVYNSVQLPDKVKTIANINELRYILYVNSLDEYKNIVTLIEAFCFSSIHKDHNLVVVANINEYWNKTIQPIIDRSDLSSKVIILSNISDEELRFVYENAALFVSPSLKEGFGYTPIEAAICRCPVLCTKCEALPDTTMGLLNYYDDPTDANELSRKIKLLLQRETDEMALLKISDAFKKRYSPRNQKEKIMKLLELN